MIEVHPDSMHKLSIQKFEKLECIGATMNCDLIQIYAVNEIISYPNFSSFKESLVNQTANYASTILEQQYQQDEYIPKVPED